MTIPRKTLIGAIMASLCMWAVGYAAWQAVIG